MAVVTDINAGPQYHVGGQHRARLHHHMGTYRGRGVHIRIRRNTGGRVHSSYRLRRAIKQMRDTGKRHVGRSRYKAIGGAAGRQFGSQDNRAGPGGSQLREVFVVGKKREVTGTRLREGGDTGDHPACFTGELQTETVRQFSQ